MHLELERFPWTFLHDKGFFLKAHSILMSIQASSGFWREYSQKPKIELHLVEKRNVSSKSEKFPPIE